MLRLNQMAEILKASVQTPTYLPMSQSTSQPDELKTGAALIIAVVGIIVPAALVVILVYKEWKASEIGSIVGLFTGLVGTLVGAFLGVQVGSSGKQKAESLAQRALGALSPEKAQEVLQK
jgi:hypothetical protein